MSNSDKIIAALSLKLHKGFVIEKDIPPEQIDQNSIKTILVILRHQMGDLIAATPMLRSLKAAYPGSKLILVTRPATKYNELFTVENAIADEVHQYEKGVENFVNLVKILRDKEIDLAVVPSTVSISTTNHLIAYYSYAKYRVGVKSLNYEPNRSAHMLNIKNDFEWSRKRTHQIERNLDIIRQLNIVPKVNRIDFKTSSEQKFYAENFISGRGLQDSKYLIAFHTGAGKAENVWPSERFAELAERFINELKADIIISEGPADKKYVDELITKTKERYGISNLIRFTAGMPETMGIIARCALFISNDTGVMHLASGIMTPIIALFGPTRAEEWGPLGNDCVSIQSATGKMNNIEVKSVFLEASQLLSQAKNA